MRASWDQYFMNIAHMVATRSTCNRGADLKYRPGRKGVGAVIVRDRMILSTGYNGSVVGAPHCDDVGHMMEHGSCLRTVHAEINAVAQAAKNGININDATIYTFYSPCWNCFKMLCNAGIKKIIFTEYYHGQRDNRVEETANQAGVQLVDLSQTLIYKAEPPALFPEVPAPQPETVKFKKLHPDAVVPTSASPGDAGLDLYTTEKCILAPGQRKLLSTGIAVELPENYAGLIWDRSGLSARQGLTTLGGVIDAGFRGEVKVIVLNSSREDVAIAKGDSIAQLLIQPILKPRIEVADALSETERGQRGFMSQTTGEIGAEKAAPIEPLTSAKEIIEVKKQEIIELQAPKNKSAGKPAEKEPRW